MGQRIWWGRLRSRAGRLSRPTQQREAVICAMLGSVGGGALLSGVLSWAADSEAGEWERAFRQRMPISREAFKGRQARWDFREVPRGLFVSTEEKVPFGTAGN